jgi:zinc protease
MQRLSRLRALTGLWIALGLCACLVAGAQPQMNVAKQKLKNGLTVLALEDHTFPSVAYYTYFRVGSRNERPGITGLSHLFEHMMFNGSAKFKPKVFDQLIEAGGGYSNAGTTTDTTEYQEEFSTATLDTVLQLEADRMRALRLDRQNLEQERGIVKEERRMRVDNSVEGSMTELLWNHAFVAHPYRWEVVGFMKDIDAIRLEDAKEYFRTYYAPNNAIVVVVGDFDTKQLFAKMQQYFGDIPAQRPPRPVVNAEPPQQGEKRINFHRAAELPAVTLGYHVGNFKDPDEAALNLLSSILSSGESSRLYQKLVYEKQIATAVSSSNDSRIDPGLFTFYVQAQQGHTTAECEAALYAILDDIKERGVTERELQKAKNTLRAGFADGFKTNLGRATLIADYQGNYGDWKKLYEQLPKHDKVTMADVQRVAKKYLTERNRTVVTLIPERESGSSGAAGADEGEKKQ